MPIVSKIIGIVLLMLGLSNITTAQSFDVGTSAEGSAADSLTFAVTVAANSNRALVVFCMQAGDSVDHTISSITYAAVGMAQHATVGTADGDNTRMDMWKLAAPATGANNVIVTFTAGVDGFFACGAESWYDNDQVTILRTAVTSTDGTTAVTSPGGGPLTPTSSLNDVVLDGIGFRYVGQGTITIGSSQTQRLSQDRSAACCQLKASSKTGSAGTTSMTWSWATAGWTSDSYIAAALIPLALATSVVPIWNLLNH